MDAKPKPADFLMEDDPEQPIKLLMLDYWRPANTFRKQVARRRKKFFAQAGTDSQNRDFLDYLRFWLAMLFVTCEGFRELKLSDPTVDALIDQHANELRLYRNGVFHYQRTRQKELQFLGDKGGGKLLLNWAEELHAALEDFFLDHLARGILAEEEAAEREAAKH